MFGSFQSTDHPPTTGFCAWLALLTVNSASLIALLNRNLGIQMLMYILFDHGLHTPFCKPPPSLVPLLLGCLFWQVDILQTNGHDCGIWVLASVAAILQGFDVTGLKESDIPTF